jgi:membrane protease YdiL (CAAX protease family)
VIRAVVIGFIVLYLGSVPWGGIAGYRGFAGWNLLVVVQLPWAVVPMALYLYLYFRYLGGTGWPRATSEMRRASLRANNLPPLAWLLAIFGGLLGLASTVPLLRIMGRLVELPQEAEPVALPTGMPSVTVLVLLIMSSIVAGVIEEAAFRGYMQGPIERRYGPVVAILISGTIFGLAHYNHHPAATLTMLPYYIWISAVYGGLAYATKSVMPSLVLHASGDVFSMTRQWASGMSEWQLPAAASPSLIWDTGIDQAFIRPLIAFGVFALVMMLVYVVLARVMRTDADSR